MPLRFKRISARNIKGIDGDFSLELTDITIASGRNASGKTSLLQLVMGLFGKASPRMLRVGAEDGEISGLIVDEDSGESWEIIRKFSPEKVDTPRAKSSVTGKIGAAAQYIQSIIDSVSINPIGEAMNASEDRQTEILLETIQFELDHAKLAESVVILDVQSVSGLSALLANAKKLPALEAIASISDRVYEERRDINRDLKKKRAHADELRAATTDKPEGQEDWSIIALNLSDQIDSLNLKQASKQIEADRENTGAWRKVEMDCSNQCVRIKKEYEEKIQDAIRKLEAERDEKIAQEKSNESQLLKGIKESHVLLSRQISEEFKGEREALLEARATAMERASKQEQDARIRRSAINAENEANDLDVQSQRMTEALLRLDTLRSGLLNNIPAQLKGLEFRGKVPYLNGVPLSEVNTEKRARFWAKVGALRAGALGIVCFDGGECMDPQHFASFIEGAKRTGLQWFVTRVTETPFRIEQL